MESMFYSLYVYLVILLKLFFIVTLIIIKFQEDKPHDTLTKVNEISKNTVMVMIALLMLYLFHPRTKSPVFIQGETKVLMFIFGILTFIDMPWTYGYPAFSKFGLSEKAFSLIVTLMITVFVTIITMMFSKH